MPSITSVDTLRDLLSFLPSPTSSTIESLPDPLVHLPAELLTSILSQLPPRTLFSLSFVSRRWRRLIVVDLNIFWWSLCMDRFWEPGARPKKMSLTDRKKEWWNLWVKGELEREIYEGQNRVIRTNRRAWRDEIDVEAAHEPTKDEMRAYYKSVRSKPKGKKPVHIQREWDCQ